MANVKLNPVLEQIRGQVGDLVFKRYEDRVILSRKPDLSGHQATAAQQAVRQRFRQAALYGKMVMADPDARARYDQAAEARRKPVFSLTVADFFNAPAIDEVDVSAYTGSTGDPIVVRASDDFEVSRVEVSLTDPDGAVLEEGAATLDGHRWVYTAQTDVGSGATVRIGVRALDRPGGAGVDQTEVTLPE